MIIGNILAFRFSTTLDGKSPLQRAQLVAEKLNRLIPQGLTPDEIKIGTLSDRPMILARDEILLVIDEDQARANATSPTALARLWADKLKTALIALRR